MAAAKVDNTNFGGRWAAMPDKEKESFLRGMNAALPHRLPERGPP